MRASMCHVHGAHITLQARPSRPPEGSCRRCRCAPPAYSTWAPECRVCVRALAFTTDLWHQYVLLHRYRPEVYVHALALVVAVLRRYVGTLIMPCTLCSTVSDLALLWPIQVKSWLGGRAPVKDIELVGLDGGTAWLGHEAPVQRRVLVCQRFELGRTVRLPRVCPTARP